MKPQAAFWDWRGKINRRDYLLWGLLFFAIKFNIDRVVAYAVFHRSWSISNYFAQDGAWDAVDRSKFYLTMTAMALPFIWVGVTLTLRRLRSAGLPPGLVVLFFVPIVSWIFFSVLCLLPEGGATANDDKMEGAKEPLLDRMLPETRWGSALAATFVVVAMTVLGTLLSASFLENYGGGLFVGLPFCLGLTATLIFGYRTRQSFRACMAVSIYAVCLGGLALLLVAIEGIFCLLMAAIPAMVLSALGGAVGYFILSGSERWRREAPQLFCAVFLGAPLLMVMEKADSLTAPLLEAKTAVVIEAAPEVVWKNVVTFRELPPPKELLFRSGIAYPICAEIKGQGVGATRYCVFSTGPFVEPIETWDEPRLLRFAVTENPASMEEWTPYREVHPPHVKGFMVSERGQFLLRPLEGNRTLLEGTTWYRHHLWPASYWQLWSDFIVHRIHLRVLNHIKFLSEINAKK